MRPWGDREENEMEILPEFCQNLQVRRSSEFGLSEWTQSEILYELSSRTQAQGTAYKIFVLSQKRVQTKYTKLRREWTGQLFRRPSDMKQVKRRDVRGRNNLQVAQQGLDLAHREVNLATEEGFLGDKTGFSCHKHRLAGSIERKLESRSGSRTDKSRDRG